MAVQAIGYVEIAGEKYKTLLRSTTNFHVYIRRSKGKVAPDARHFEDESKYLNLHSGEATKFLNYETVRC